MWKSLQYFLAQWHYQNSRYERARPLFRQLCQKKSPPKGSFLYHALCLAQEGHREALEELEREPVLEESVRHLFRGRICYDLGLWQESRQALEVALSHNPKNLLAKAYLCLLDWQEHRKLAEEALPFFPPDPALLARAYTLLLRWLAGSEQIEPERLAQWREKWEREKDFFQELFETPPSHPLLGRCERHLIFQEYDKALQVAEEAHQENPYGVEVLLYLSYSYWKQGRLKEGLETLKKRQRLLFWATPLLEEGGGLAGALHVFLLVRLGKVGAALRPAACLSALDEADWEAELAVAEVETVLKLPSACAHLEGLARRDPEEFHLRLRELYRLVRQKSVNREVSATSKKEDSTQEQ